MSMIVVYYPPTPQKRHRTTTRGGFARNYDPSARAKKQFVAKLKCQDKPSRQALSVQIVFYIERPKSHLTTKGKLRKGVNSLHISKPDLDNLAKFVLDACNGILWVDDSQIWCLALEKVYTVGEPRILINIQEIQE